MQIRDLYKMSDKKNIDRLFQEKFKDFEVAPNDAVWNRISESLPNKKKKRRVVALWWQIGGVAAVIALLLTVGSSIFNSDIETIENPVIVDTKEENGTQNSNGTNSASNKKQNDITDDHQSKSSKYVDSSEDYKAPDDTSEKNSAPENKNASKQLTSPHTSQLNAIVNSSNQMEEKSNSEEANSLNKITGKNKNEDKVASKTGDEEDDIFLKSKVKSTIEKSIKKNESAVVDNGTSEKSQNTSNSEYSSDLDKEKANALLEESNKESIEKAIAAQDHIDEKEKEDEQSRWSIAPNVAPVYFNSLGQGSSLGSQFNENSKSGDINMSYGITGSYAITKKLKIRAGINRVNLSQTTANVLAFSNNEFAARSSSNSGSRPINENIKSKGSNVVLMSGNMLNGNTTPELFNAKTTGNVDQRFGFIEVPLEAEYRLLDKKFGLNVIGGFSTFFLNQNEIYADVDGEATLIGEASNINSTSFSANLGLGLDYKLSKQWNINLEPQFKYQINTFNNTSGDFRPFFIGVYTGLSFKF
ncbi:hypothetical protein [Winogradskyella flava]|uniref:Outer membrane protein beta-barrel domain-containing protein n=1 Tax=Winogradskyella flava TaxID=1884876 RepID=A0A842IPJ3_9FLAO|nr:hypothetical protein [Winogradskyella flava]MBC2843806.1 hypothetical protein [Winogradskyella flava]